MFKLNIKKYTSLLLLSLSLTCGVNLLLPCLSLAQVRVSPLVITSETKQGKATGVITLTNQGSQESRVRLYAQPFTYNLNGFEVLESSPNDLSPYLIFSPTELVLQPGETRRVRLLANLLPSMTNGEYRAVIFTEPLREAATSGLSINTRIGVVVYVHHGETVEGLTAETINFDQEKRELFLVVKNEGNVTIIPKITWQLTQESKTLFTGVIPAISVIAEGERNIPIKLSDANTENQIPAGSYTLTGEIRWGDNKNPKNVSFSVPVQIPE